MQRRKLSREFKLEAVKLVREWGVAGAQATRNLGLHENVLRKWLREADLDPQSAFTYGARRVWHELLAEGLSCGVYRVERLMRVHGLMARRGGRGLPKAMGVANPMRCCTARIGAANILASSSSG